MLALVLPGWQQPPELRDVPIPELGPGEVLARVGDAGARHSDLHLMEWPEGVVAFAPPFVLGHEIAGSVEAVGAGVTGLEPRAGKFSARIERFPLSDAVEAYERLRAGKV